MISHSQYRNSSSPMSSSSSHDDVYSCDRFFAPEYPSADIKNWRSTLQPNGSLYYDQGAPTPLMQPEGFLLDSSQLYHPHSTIVPPPRPIMSRRATPVRSGKRGSQDSTGSDFATLSVGEDFNAAPAPPTKRCRKEPVPNARVSGACTRCKRLKMKCTFADSDATCARCIVGGHECIVLGRKPRSPGMREILRKQIREKDTMIDNLLAKLNPAAPSTTPLALNVSKLALTPEQRNVYRDVLAYFEKSQGVRSSEKAKIDVSSLDEDSEYDSDSEAGEAEGDSEDTSAALYQPFLPTKCAPAGLVAKTVLETRSRSRLSSPAASVLGRSESEGSDDVAAIEAGIGSLSYFEPGPSSNLDLRRLIIERQAAPDILLSGLVTNEDVGKLFQIYWKWINPVIPILDENIHTPASVLSRCPFLFTVICAVASRYYEEKADMYPLAIHLAKAAAANAFLDGWKTVEMCQAYTLMACYMPPARRWDEDRTWFYSGIAFRLAIDMDLSRLPAVKPSDERTEREVLNRLRTYIICYIVDRSFGINLGKPLMVPETELIRNITTLFFCSKYQHKGDSYIVSLVELYRIMTRFVEIANPALEARSDMTEVELIATHKVFAEELVTWEAVTASRCANEESSQDIEDRLRMGLMHSVYQYCRLVTFSAGLQQVMKLNKLKEDKIFFTGCLHAGSAVINCVMDRILPTGFIRYSPEHVFALSAFGTAVLMKCLRPEFASKLVAAQEDRIVQLVQRLLKALEGDHVSGDDYATPRRSYAQFLQQLLATRAMERESRRNTENIPHPTLVHEPPAETATFPTYVDDTKPSEFTGHLTDASFVNPWDAINAQHDLNGMNQLLGFNESEYLQTFMAFPDQTWFMQ